MSENTEPKEWCIEDPTPEDMERADCSSVEPDVVKGYDPKTDEDNVAEEESA